ncbi:MAG: PAS domain-containing protein, partial [Chloroflexota bacterium]|nr:PAS domain-containing protein [Chloroflexota bacterium]
VGRLWELNRRAQREIAERGRAEQRTEHLNAVLRAIRDVNQLIVRESDREALLQGICDILIKTRGYYSAWIILYDGEEGVGSAAQAGLEAPFATLVDRMAREELAPCVQRVMEGTGFTVIEDAASVCEGCPLASTHEGQGAMTARLVRGDNHYGFLCVSLPTTFVDDEEEQALFKEVAGDVAWALHSIEVEENLAQERRLIDALLRNTLDNIYFKDSESRFIRINEAMATYFGLEDPTEAVGKTDFDLFAEEHARAAYADEQRIMESGETLVKEEKETWPDGRETWVSTIKAPLRGNDGQIVGTFGISRDITDRVRADKRQRELEEQLQAARRLEAIGQLAGGVAHDFNNLLTPIMGYAQLMQEELPPDDPLQEDVKEILDAANRARDLVQRLLAFGRKQMLQMEPVNLNRIVSEFEG